ncbi:hypothetical protein SAMN04487928_1246 [Butyrivibrio proteoclasticus]|uniref:Uncharacterized protein n=1 Tax=Butyrivibrio proteoclasticus TaxID=43305 RepID=A0A1I5WNC7_9FIRM|nr:hypothetical protein [Butyrivibrio proteoclasticus]SFQ21304.1 hypothetical protein SAMN04487928_1246 [Butyrivibrio proteoclasticus]
MKHSRLFTILTIFSEVTDFYSTTFSLELDKRSFDEIIDCKNKVEYVSVRLITSDTSTFDSEKLRDAMNEFLCFVNCPFDRAIKGKLCLYVSALKVESKTTMHAHLLVLEDAYSWELYKKINTEGVKI